MDNPDPRLGEVGLDIRGSTSLKTVSLLCAVVGIIGLLAGYFIPASEGAVTWVAFSIGAAAAVVALAARFVNKFIRLRVGDLGLLRENELLRREEFLRWEDVLEIRSATWTVQYKYGITEARGRLLLKTADSEMAFGNEVPKIHELVAAAERETSEQVLDRAREELEEKGEARFGALGFNRGEILVHDTMLSFRLEELNNVFDDGRKMWLLVKGRALAAWSGKAFDVPNRTAFYALVGEAMAGRPKPDEVEGALSGAEHKTAVWGAHVGITGAIILLIVGGGLVALCGDVLTLGLLPVSFFGWAALAGSVVPGVAGLVSFRRATETGSMETTLGGVLKKWLWLAVLVGAVVVALVHWMPRVVVLDGPAQTRFLVGDRPYEHRARLRTLGLSRLEIASTRGSETIEKVTLELKEAEKWLYNPKGEGVYQVVRVRFNNEGGKYAKKGSVYPLERIEGRAVIKADAWDFVLEVPATVRSRSNVEKLALVRAN